MADDDASGEGELSPGGAAVSPPVRVTSVVPAQSTATNLRVKTREGARRWLAIVLSVTFLGTIAAAFAGALTRQWSNVREWLDIVLPAQTAILGSAIGFYFGTQRGGNGNGD